MKASVKIILALLLLAAAGSLFFLSKPGTQAQRDLEATRRDLREQGFKVDLNEFDLSTPIEVSNRVSMIGTTSWAAMTNPATRYPYSIMGFPPLMEPVGQDASRCTGI